MATIAISNLYLTGSILFSDEETFLDDLSNEQASLAYGGLFVQPTTTIYHPNSLTYTFTPTATSPICNKFHPCPTGLVPL